MQTSTAVFKTSLKEQLQTVANTIRNLSIDAVQYAGSGHAGTPMGCAEIGAYLYGYFLKHNPKNPKWINRDRFILSAGHASMLQYSCLHLCGYPLSLDDLKQFRQLNSKTPSHPEYGITEGVETTTGVDGQGVAHAIGQALGLKILGAKFNQKHLSIFDAKVVVLAGDGCLMEGVSHEASALAGHLKLDNLILIYDRNKTSLDGFVSETCTEDTKKRYEAYGWKVFEIDGHDFDSIHHAFSQIRECQNEPVLIIADTIIGKGSITKAGSYLIHSGPIGNVERQQVKKDLLMPLQEFYVSEDLYDFFNEKLISDGNCEELWDQKFQEWRENFPDLYLEFLKMREKSLPENIEERIRNLSIPNTISGREASNYVLNYLGDILPGLYGGSADLARSDMTHMHRHPVILPSDFSGRNIKYGVREFGMASMAIGLAQTDMITPFIGTFLSFSDYMLSAVRMAALTKVQVIYQLTHDSIFIGQDGPTHQPIEHLACLRAIPNLQVIRPADANEIKMAWLAALKYSGPTAIILSKQQLPLCQGTAKSYADGLGLGAYIVKQNKEKKADFTLIATGSEVSLALKVSEALEHKGFAVSVISMPCWEIFENQPDAYKSSILGKDTGLRVSIEAASELGWHKYVLTGKTISIKSFGKSGLSVDLAKEFGFTVEKIMEKILV